MTTRVLIVEDEPIIAMDLATSLTMRGYVVYTAVTGPDAIRIAEEEKPDLILMDIILQGDMDGIEATAKIREGNDIPIVYMTAHTDDATMQKAKSTHPYGYLIKPVNEYELYSTLETVIGRHAFEEHLRHNEENYRLLVENASDAIAIVQDGIFVYVNNSAVELSGYRADELYARPFLDIVHADDRKKLLDNLANRLQGLPADPVYELRMTDKSGKTHWTEIRASLTTWQGRPAVVGFLRDLTPRKNAEEALAENESRFKRITDNMLDMIAEVDSGGRFIYVSPSHFRFLGFSPDELYGKSILDLIHPDDLPAVEDAYARAGEEGKPAQVRCRYRCRDGRYAWLESLGNPYMDEKGAFAGGTINSREITARVKLETMQAALVENTMQGIVIYANDRIEFVNNAVSVITGFTREELLKFTMNDIVSLIHPDDREDMRKMLMGRLAGRLIKPRSEFRIIRKNGNVRHLTSYATRLEYGEERAIQVAVADITDRMLAEKRMREAEERTLLIADNITETLWIMDMNMVPVYITPSVERTRGFTLEELKIMKLEEHLAPGSLGEALRVMGEILTRENLEDRGLIINKRIELEFYRKDGSTFWSENEFTLLRDRNGNPSGILGVGREISERKQAEMELRRALEEKEYLLREIHHRVKNNMMVIHSLLGLQSEYIRDPKAREALAESRSRIASMIKLYDQLNQAARQSHVDVPMYIRSLTKDLFQSYNPNRADISMESVIDEIDLDEKKTFYIGLMINELVGNSLKHAFNDTGSRRAAAISVSLKRGGGGAILEVADNGNGLSGEIDVGKSTGFGLNLVGLLVRQLGGTVEVMRTGGSRFTIRFPLT